MIRDPRYGAMSPHFGMPAGHLAVRSYLAVPVQTRGGEVIGGLFFGHPAAGVFSGRHERLAVGVAAWAAIALDNASLYSQANAIQEELREANRAKDEFLALVSHELRTPTTTIYGGARLLHTRGATLDPETIQVLTQDLAQESGRLARLIENLLVFARLEIGKEIDMRAVSPDAIVDRVVTAFEKAHPSRRLDLSVDGPVPSIFAEPTYLEQTLENLMSNADKYSPPELPIEVEAVHRDGEVMVAVRDRGPGVDPAEISHMFDSFYRSQRTSQLASGHGLGLTPCERLITAQGGRIWPRTAWAAASKPGSPSPCSNPRRSRQRSRSQSL